MCCSEVTLTHIVYISLSISFSFSYISFLFFGYLNRYVHVGTQRRKDCVFFAWIFEIKIDAIIHALRKEHTSIHKEKWEVEPLTIICVSVTSL